MISPWSIIVGALSSVDSRISISSLRARRPCREESELFSKAPGVHIGLENAVRMSHQKSGFLLGVLAFEFSGTDFNQTFMAASRKSRQVKPTHENDTRLGS